ncbi:MAG: hypothetical protein JW811_04275 [Clostridiales bacterium]|nr:hypothetical protein [Clostridiales bacterium]
METVSVGIQNLYAPCSCACKYCLLQSSKKAEGVDYYRGRKIAERFIRWGKEHNLENLPCYSIAYCADYPELFDNISFNQAIGFAGASFLQCNGIEIKTISETDKFIAKLKIAGIKTIDVTFFGNEKYHDRFSVHTGDYRFMLQLAKSAKRHGMTCAPSIVITEENKDMLEALFNILGQITDISNIHSFLPDYRGRGYLMEDSRLTEKSYALLSDQVKSTMNIQRYQTEKDWLSDGKLPEYTKRALVITLREDNIEMLESMTCDEIVSYVENLDKDYYRAIPPINQLAELYGNPQNTKLYRLRDLLWMWQKRYRDENHITIYNVTDERFCYTIRS